MNPLMNDADIMFEGRILRAALDRDDILVDVLLRDLEPDVLARVAINVILDVLPTVRVKLHSREGDSLVIPKIRLSTVDDGVEVGGSRSEDCAAAFAAMLTYLSCQDREGAIQTFRTSTVSPILLTKFSLAAGIAIMSGALDTIRLHIDELGNEQS